MTTKKSEMTQSAQYDKKLRDDLYLQMAQLNDNVVEIKECEDRDDAEAASAILMEILLRLPPLIESYTKCIEGGKDV